MSLEINCRLHKDTLKKCIYIKQKVLYLIDIFRFDARIKSFLIRISNPISAWVRGVHLNDWMKPQYCQTKMIPNKVVLLERKCTTKRGDKTIVNQPHQLTLLSHQLLFQIHTLCQLVSGHSPMLLAAVMKMKLVRPSVFW